MQIVIMLTTKAKQTKNNSLNLFTCLFHLCTKLSQMSKNRQQTGQIDTLTQSQTVLVECGVNAGRPMLNTDSEAGWKSNVNQRQDTRTKPGRRRRHHAREDTGRHLAKLGHRKVQACTWQTHSPQSIRVVISVFPRKSTRFKLKISAQIPSRFKTKQNSTVFTVLSGFLEWTRENTMWNDI